MNDATKTNDRETQAKTQMVRTSEKGDNKKMLNLRPLPQNRPIATNVSDNSDELMGYLD